MSRSIFVKHKLLFSLMLTLTCLDVDGRSQPADVKYMMSGLSGKPIDLESNANPDPERFTE